VAGKLNFKWEDEGLRRQFKKLKKQYSNKAKVRKIAKPASRIAVQFLRKNAIVRGDTAKSTPKGYFDPKKRKRNGATAVYYKGNARRSMKNFSFRKSYYMHVGANVNQGGKAGGSFNSGYKTEGYYNYFLQYGTKKMRPRRQMSKAIMQAKGPVQASLRKNMNMDLVTTAIKTKER